MADLSEKVKQVREQFLKKYNGSILDDTFDERDVNWVKSSDPLIRCCLKAHKTGGDVNKATDLLNDILLFRAKYKLNDVKQTDLDAELRALDGIFYKGTDKQGLDVLHFIVSKQKKGYKLEETKLYIAFYYNQHFMKSPETPVVSLMDCSNCTIGNMDLDLSKFVVTCQNTYFPCIGAYTLMFKMPLALEAVWTIIKGFFDAEQNKKTYMVSRKNIQEYISQDQLLPHMIKEKDPKK